jgi:hypothetical protein
MRPTGRASLVMPNSPENRYVGRRFRERHGLALVRHGNVGLDNPFDGCRLTGDGSAS